MGGGKEWAMTDHMKKVWPLSQSLASHRFEKAEIGTSHRGTMESFTQREGHLANIPLAS